MFKLITMGSSQDSSNFLLCKKLKDNAFLPRWGVGDAGYDLFSVENYKIEPHTKTLVSTNIAIRIPPNWVGIIKPRSGLSSKTGLTTDAGVIDSSYRGEIKVLLANIGSEAVDISSGDRVAQLVIVPYLNKPPIWVDDLDETTRGASGFGSTGKN